MAEPGHLKLDHDVELLEMQLGLENFASRTKVESGIMPKVKEVWQDQRKVVPLPSQELFAQPPPSQMDKRLFMNTTENNQLPGFGRLPNLYHMTEREHQYLGDPTHIGAMESREIALAQGVTTIGSTYNVWGNEKVLNTAMLQKTPILNKRIHQVERTLNTGHLKLQECCERVVNETEKHAIVFSILQVEDPGFSRYKVLRFLELAVDNWDSSKQILPLAMNTLEKFGINLLKPVERRPELWRSIKCNSAMFQKTLEPINGVYSTLALLGYEDIMKDIGGNVISVEFNDCMFDRDKVRKLTADFVIAKYEFEAIIKGAHPQMELLNLLISEECEKPQQPCIDIPRNVVRRPHDKESAADFRRLWEKPAMMPHNSLHTTAISLPPEDLFAGGLTQSYQRPTSSILSTSRPNTTWVLNGNLASPGALQVLQNPPQDRVHSPVLEDLRYRQSSTRQFEEGNRDRTFQPVERRNQYEYFPATRENQDFNSGVINFGRSTSGQRTSHGAPLDQSRQMNQQEFGFSVPSLYNLDKRDNVKIDPSAGARLSSPSGLGYCVNTSVGTSPSVTNRGDPLPASAATPKEEARIQNGPDEEWNCQHCTFLNPPTTKVCQMCDKTSWVKNETKPKVPLRHVIPVNQLKYAVFLGPRESEDGQGSPGSPFRQGNAHQQIEQKFPIIIDYEDGHPVVSLSSVPRPYPSHHVSFQDSREYPRVEQYIYPPRTSVVTRAIENEHLTPSLPVRSPGLGDTFASEPSQIDTTHLHWNASLEQSPMIAMSQRNLTNVGQTQHTLTGYPHGQMANSQHVDRRVSTEMQIPSRREQKDQLEEAKKKRQETQRRAMEQDRLKQEGTDLINKLREAENRGFSVELYAIAAFQHPASPFEFLSNFYPEYLEEVMDNFADGDEMLGKLSRNEAEEAYIACDGQVEEAVEWAKRIRTERLNDLSFEGKYSKEDVLEAIFKAKGDVEEAKTELERMSFAPFLERIWSEENFDPTLHERLKGKGLDEETKIRLIMADQSTTWGRGKTAVKLMDLTENSVEECIEAAVLCGYTDRARRYVEQSCAICYSQVSMKHLTTNLYCQCLLCYDCWSDYFSVTIKEKHIRHLICPLCGKPDMKDEAIILEYFSHINILLRQFVDLKTLDPKTFELYEIKLRDFTLKKDPKFRWCAHCPENGFIWDDPLHIKMICHKCRKSTCFRCHEKWLPQHQGISCEKFREWKEANDPEFLKEQTASLSSQLAKNGIKCPDCHFTYDLARGGCMHFRCIQCGYEFCSGCFQPFKNGAQCTFHESCKHKGLHAHHPRNCLYYMRDLDKAAIKKLLTDNNVEYDMDEPQSEGNVCHVMEQHETDGGMKDEECGAEAPDGNAGLCEKHYKEYLVKLVNDNGIDPVVLMDAEEIRRLSDRSFVPCPKKQRREKKKVYLERLREFVVEKLPLPLFRRQGIKKQTHANDEEPEQRPEEEPPAEEAVNAEAEGSNESDQGSKNDSSDSNRQSSQDEPQPDLFE